MSKLKNASLVKLVGELLCSRPTIKAKDARKRVRSLLMCILQMIFKAVVIAILGSCLATRTLAQFDETRDEQLWPSKDVGRVLVSAVHFSLRSPFPLQNCIYTLPTGSTFDFSQGHNSTKIGEYEGYNGLGLEEGDCGCSFNVANTSFEGVVTCKVRRVNSTDWIESASTLRITGLSEQALPSFDIVPRNASLQSGDTIEITCNAENRPLEVCRFILPDGTEVNYDRGPNSRLTDEYRYLGSSLAEGKCGISIRVDAKYNGHIVCKIGKEPLTSNGRWHMGVMVIQTKERPIWNTVVNSGNDGRPLVVIRPKSTTTPRPTTVQPGTDCGRNHLDQVTSLISGGNDAVVGEFPWHAGIYKISGTTYVQQCGGTLITTNVVLTAAHCFVSEITGKVRDKTLYRIGLGKHLREWNEDSRGERVQRSAIKEIIVPPRYSGRRGKFQYDIAVVILRKEAKITQFVDIVCMDWDSSSKKLQLTEGAVGVATGWGATEKDASSPELQYVDLPWVSEPVCLAAVKEDTKVENYYTVDKFCAGYRNRNTSVCRGDSGGGLFFKNVSTQSYFLRGVTSVSFELSKTHGRCANQLYTGFTDVATYIKDLILPALFKA